MYASQLTQDVARKLYSAANNNGEGYSLGDEDATVADAASNLGEVILRARTTSDVYVVRAHKDDRIVAIGGDASGCMPWAVDLDLDSVEA